ncbi:MAG: hypothetical protein ACT4QC_05960 [Planctomycetaceae bacterium]
MKQSRWVMLVRRHLKRGLAIAAVPVALGCGVWWHRSLPPEYVARAQIALPAAIELPPDDADSAVEELVLAPEVLQAALELLRQRGVSLPLPSPLDSESEWLLDHTSAKRDAEATGSVVQINCSVANRDSAVPILQSLVDGLIGHQPAGAQTAADPDAPRREIERAQLVQAVARQVTVVEGLQSPPPGDSADSARLGKNLPPVETLLANLDAARRGRLELEARQAETRAELAAGSSLEQIVAELPQQPEWNATRTLLSQARLVRLVHEQQAAIAAAQAVYGRKHPRMVEQNAQLARLNEQLAAHAASDAPLAPSADVPLATVLVNDLERRITEAGEAEQQLEQQLATATADREVRARRESELAEARHELEFLRGEEARLDQELAAARRAHAARLARVIEGPTLASDPVRADFWRPLGISGAIGLCLCAWLWRSPAGVTASPQAAGRAPRRVYFRSHQEVRLAKLKAQAAASAPG